MVAKTVREWFLRYRGNRNKIPVGAKLVLRDDAWWFVPPEPNGIKLYILPETMNELLSAGYVVLE